MARIQLALNVPDLDEAIAFYEVLLGESPHKRRPGYANFAVDDPPLKLVLIESDDAQQLNHLGVEVSTTDQVATAIERLSAAGLEPDVREQELCCHAVQDKLWVDHADARWEVYTITDDTPAEPEPVPAAAATTSCC